jgi:integrase
VRRMAIANGPMPLSSNFFNIRKTDAIKKEIAGSTVRGYYKAIKLFAEVNDILLPWSKIKRGLPRARHYADDRIPTPDEIRKLVEYPDRRIKAIVYTMASSGIRLGAWDYLRWGHIKPIVREEQNICGKVSISSTTISRTDCIRLKNN